MNERRVIRRGRDERIKMKRNKRGIKRKKWRRRGQKGIKRK